MSRSRRTLILAAAFAALLPFAFLGQVKTEPRPKLGVPPPESRRAASLRIDTNLVLVPVSVLDPQNHPVTGLEKEHFRVLDDRVEQAITHFSMDDEPVAVGLVFDISGSMGPKLQKSRQAAAEFFRTSNTDDEFFLVEFNDQPKLVVPLTRNVEEIQNQLTWAQSKGRTALLDAVFMALSEMKKSKKNRKALLIISDGGDNSSRYSEGEVKKLVRENDVLIYAIGVFESGGGRSRTTEEAGGPGSAQRPLRTDRRTPPSGGCCRTAGYRRQNRRRTAQPLRPRLLARQPAARRPLSHAASEGGPAQRPARPAPVLPPRLLRAHAVARASAAIALAPSAEELSCKRGVYLGGG